MSVVSNHILVNRMIAASCNSIQMLPASNPLGPGCSDGSHCLLPITRKFPDSHEINHMHLPRDSMAIPHMMMVGQRILPVTYSCILQTRRI